MTAAAVVVSSLVAIVIFVCLRGGCILDSHDTCRGAKGVHDLCWKRQICRVDDDVEHSGIDEEEGFKACRPPAGVLFAS